ncbi:MAG: hypothetical protein ACI9OO_000490 [Bacteroidia bacterium]|jgi:hypothetical protein
MVLDLVGGNSLFVTRQGGWTALKFYKWVKLCKG